MTTAELAKSWLNSQGFRCNLDDDGDAVFKYQGANMYVSVDKNDPLFLKIVMPGIYDVENDYAKALEAVNKVTTRLKVAKAILVQGHVHLLIEMFVDTTPEVDDFFERCCDILIAARKEFYDAMND